MHWDWCLIRLSTDGNAQSLAQFTRMFSMQKLGKHFFPSAFTKLTTIFAGGRVNILFNTSTFKEENIRFTI